MENKYNHKLIEDGIENKWKVNKYFSTHDTSKKPFTIILPPPNVTGKLHLGHAWDGYIQDTIIRYKKLNDFDVFWVAGMDHAGIATQAKVEERLRQDNISKYDLGRDKFIEKVWDWKEEYASTIRKQWETLGLALDYDNERFTLDDNLSEAVSKVFIELHKTGDIYRGERPINWDPKLETVLSNIEVDSKDTSQTMYYIDYPIVGENEVITIATVRTETLFSDVAVAINPKDEKMKKFIGKKIMHPLRNIELPVIGDETIEIGKGTGAMKVSAHSEMDYEIIMKNNLEVIESIDKKGLMNFNAGEFQGQDRFEARKTIVEFLESKNLISKKEVTSSPVGYSSRSGEAIEVLVQPQWFVKMDKFSEEILGSLKSPKTVKFNPERFSNTLQTWMEDSRDWCISRQLWWGHRIPAWYKGEEIKVQKDSPGEGWKQDDDVLDTWFSSGLAPFSFLGWPQKDVSHYYPTQLLVTGYDIIFFWVARMYFQSQFFMKDIPFENVWIHGLIRAEDGKKMSKSLGNGIDPMDVIDEYGSDSLRWFLLTNSSPGQDLRYSEEKIKSSWGLCNKLWNISKYIIEIMPENDIPETEADKWIKNKLSNLLKLIESKIDDFEWTVIGKEITTFIMDDFSSWYIEISKTNPNKKIASEILQALLIGIHPFLPFTTDFIFNKLTNNEILDQKYPSLKVVSSKSDIDLVIKITKSIRDFRQLKNISNKTKIQYALSIKIAADEIAMINHLTFSEYKENKDAIIPLQGIKLFIKLTNELRADESKRINEKIKFLNSEIVRAKGMLANKKFVEKAPKNKIDEEKLKLENFEKELISISKNE